MVYSNQRMKMRKVIAIVLMMLLVLSALAACGSSLSDSGKTTGDKESTGNDSKFIAFSASTLSLEFFAGIADSIKANCEANGHRFESASAENDNNLQAEQIENFVTMGASHIVVIGSEVVSLADTLKSAREKGAYILICGSVPDDPDAYDCCWINDTYNGGQMEAQMAADWINETFPDAADDSVQVGIIEFSDSETYKLRGDAFREIEDYTSKAKIVKAYSVTEDADASAKVQEATELLLCQY